MFHTVLRQSEILPMLYSPVKTNLFLYKQIQIGTSFKTTTRNQLFIFKKSAHVSLKLKKIELLHYLKKNPAHIDNNKVVVSIKTSRTYTCLFHLTVYITPRYIGVNTY